MSIQLILVCTVQQTGCVRSNSHAQCLHRGVGVLLGLTALLLDVTSSLLGLVTGDSANDGVLWEWRAKWRVERHVSVKLPLITIRNAATHLVSRDLVSKAFSIRLRLSCFDLAFTSSMLFFTTLLPLGTSRGVSDSVDDVSLGRVELAGELGWLVR